MFTCLKAGSCFHVIGYLAICVNKQLSKVATEIIQQIYCHKIVCKVWNLFLYCHFFWMKSVSWVFLFLCLCLFFCFLHWACLSALARKGFLGGVATVLNHFYLHTICGWRTSQFINSHTIPGFHFVRTFFCISRSFFLQPEPLIYFWYSGFLTSNFITNL